MQASIRRLRQRRCLQRTSETKEAGYRPLLERKQKRRDDRQKKQFYSRRSVATVFRRQNFLATEWHNRIVKRQRSLNPVAGATGPRPIDSERKQLRSPFQFLTKLAARQVSRNALASGSIHQNVGQINVAATTPVRSFRPTIRFGRHPWASAQRLTDWQILNCHPQQKIPPRDRRPIAGTGDGQGSGRRSEIDPQHGLGQPKSLPHFMGRASRAIAATGGASNGRGTRTS